MPTVQALIDKAVEDLLRRLNALPTTLSATGATPLPAGSLANIVKTLGDPGSDDNVPSEQAVREAIGGFLSTTVPTKTVVGRNSPGTGASEFVTISQQLDWLS